jgi:putative methionine-R-sulfoxide reductase with GAF domain/two-component sensor histidine kinase
MANQAGLAIESARLFEAEQRRAEQFRVISQVGRRITSILAVDDLLVQMARLIREAFNYDQVGFALIEGNEAVCKAGAGPFWDDPQFQPVRLKVGQEGITGWVAATGQPLLVPDVSQEPRHYSLPQASETRSELAMPLKSKDAVIGVLIVMSDQRDAFDESDLAVLQALANQGDLHDSATQSLYAVTMFAEAASRLLASGEIGPASDHLSDVRETAQEALQEMRLLIFELRPPILEKEGLVTALQTRLELVEGRSGLETELKAEGVSDLTPEIEEGFYRVAQEVLNNILKHAQAHSVTVQLCRDQQKVILEITDDGIGFDPHTNRGKGGLGLAGMEERVVLLGGRLIVRSTPGQGTSVRVEVSR